jgi:hypothetical protein
MPVLTSNQGAESKRWLVTLLATSATAGGGGRPSQPPALLAALRRAPSAAGLKYCGATKRVSHGSWCF